MNLCVIVSKDSHDVQFFNVAQLVVRYTRKFASTDPREAVQYFYLLKYASHALHWLGQSFMAVLVFFFREIETPHGSSLFTQCLSELVLETREVWHTRVGQTEAGV